MCPPLLEEEGCNESSSNERGKKEAKAGVRRQEKDTVFVTYSQTHGCDPTLDSMEVTISQYTSLPCCTRFAQRLTQAGFFLAFRRPGFFLSTRLASEVTVPAANLLAKSSGGLLHSSYLSGARVSEPAHGPAVLLPEPR